MRLGFHRDLLPGWLTLFLVVLRHRPDRAIEVAYHYITRRRVRAFNRLWAAGAALPNAYRLWIAIVERRETRAMADAAAGPTAIPIPRIPTFSIVVDAADWTDRAALDRTLRSIRAQGDTSTRLIVSGAGQAAAQAKAGETWLPQDGQDASQRLHAALAMADGDFTIILPPDAILPSWAVARYREAACAHPDAAILYGDEDRIDAAARRSDPWLKPQWNAELILAQDYVSNACAVATPALRAMGAIPAALADASRYALILAVAGPAGRTGATIRHIPHILCHLPVSAPRTDAAARTRVVAATVAPLRATAETGPFGTVRVQWPLPDPAPSVTIIIPTRDRVDLMQACVGSLLSETDYPDYDIVVVDNGSILPETHAWFDTVTADPRVAILHDDRPYNFSTLNNVAAATARGDYLCLLNNDTEIVDGAWLRELMRQAVRPGVGAVGAKLLYPDRSIQHAGVVMGLGNAAGHAHRALADDQPGYFALAHCAHEVSAVTAACLVVERRKFEAVGGLDAADLQIAYNDVDFCLKLAQAGWRNIYEPQAVLIHHESKSRGQDLSPQHIERYHRELATLQQRWGTTTLIDPMHHPRLDRSSETYRLQL